MSDKNAVVKKVKLSFSSSEDVREFIARTGGVFNGKMIDLVFSRYAFLKYLKLKNELEYVV